MIKLIIFKGLNKLYFQKTLFKTWYMNFKKKWTKIENWNFRMIKIRRKSLEGLKMKFIIFRGTKNLFNLYVYFRFQFSLFRQFCHMWQTVSIRGQTRGNLDTWHMPNLNGGNIKTNRKNQLMQMVKT
jgi:hypothetical protein